MASATLSGATSTAARRQFVAKLPRITNVPRFRYRNRPGGNVGARRSPLGQVVARVARHGVVHRGVEPVQIVWTGIAANAARHVNGGRPFGFSSRPPRAAVSAWKGMVSSSPPTSLGSRPSLLSRCPSGAGGSGY